MNPLDVINQLPIPAKYRKWIIYFLIPVAVLAYGVWQAVGGDWKAFWPALVAAIIGAVAHAFTNLGVSTTNEVPVYDHSDDEIPLPSVPANPTPAVIPTPDEVVAAQANTVPDGGSQ